MFTFFPKRKIQFLIQKATGRWLGGGDVGNGAVSIVGTAVAKTHESMHELIYPAGVVRESQRDHQCSLFLGGCHSPACQKIRAIETQQPVALNPEET